MRESSLLCTIFENLYTAKYTHTPPPFSLRYFAFNSRVLYSLKDLDFKASEALAMYQLCLCKNAWFSRLPPACRLGWGAALTQRCPPIPGAAPNSTTAALVASRREQGQAGKFCAQPCLGQVLKRVSEGHLSGSSCKLHFGSVNYAQHNFLHECTNDSTDNQHITQMSTLKKTKKTLT